MQINLQNKYEQTKITELQAHVECCGVKHNCERSTLTKSESVV